MPFEYAGVALQQHLFTETIASLYRKVTLTPCKKCGIPCKNVVYITQKCGIPRNNVVYHTKMWYTRQICGILYKNVVPRDLLFNFFLNDTTRCFNCSSQRNSKSLYTC